MLPKFSGPPDLSHEFFRKTVFQVTLELKSATEWDGTPLGQAMLGRKTVISWRIQRIYVRNAGHPQKSLEMSIPADFTLLFSGITFPMQIIMSQISLRFAIRDIC